MKYHIETFGCQMNDHDSERLAGMLVGEGHSMAESLSEADIVILNTCCIREKAEHKVFSEIGKLSKMKNRGKNMLIGVCGCIAQKEKGRIIKKFPNVDMVFGTMNISSLPDILRRIKNGKKVVDVREETAAGVSETPLLRSDGVKAWITIMEGCNNYCSYCIVPYVRGRERSRPAERIIEEVERLAKDGYREFTLLGQNVNSYRSDSEIKCDFTGLLERLNKIDEVLRIRFVTSHPKDFGERLIYAMRDLEKVCRNIHLPVQCGSSKVLQMMNRGYTREEYMDKIKLLKEIIPDVGITTDIIVGFPGETEADFEETVSILEKIRYDSIFSFNYSPRKPAASAKFLDDVTPAEKSRRLDIVQTLQKKITLEKNIALEGEVETVLVDGKSKRADDELMGRTEQNRVVNFSGSQSMLGRIVKVKILKGHSNSLKGEII